MKHVRYQTPEAHRDLLQGRLSPREYDAKSTENGLLVEETDCGAPERENAVGRFSEGRDPAEK